MIADVTNSDRALSALSALTVFAQESRADNPEEAIGDLVTNLLHLARAIGVDPDRVASRSLAMMESEIEEDGGGDLPAIHRAMAAVFRE
jgi:hypothetical protein